MDVLGQRSRPLRLRGVLIVVVKQFAVLFHRESRIRPKETTMASGSAERKESMFRRAMARARFPFAGMGVERAATPLTRGNHDFDAVVRKDAGGGFHGAGVTQRHDAAGQQGDSPSWYAALPDHLARRGKELVAHARQAVVEVLEVSWQPTQQSAAANELPNAGLHIKLHSRACRPSFEQGWREWFGNRSPGQSVVTTDA